MSTASSIARGLAGNPAIGIAIVVAAAAAFVWWKYGDELKRVVTEKLNPLSDQNLAYSGVNAAGAAVSGDKDWTLGGWIYDLTHPPYDPNEGNGGSATPASKGPLRR